MDVLPQKPLVREFFAFNTMNSVSAWTANGKALDEVVALCSRYEGLFSRTDPSSGLARLNAAEGRKVPVDRELAFLVSQALGYCAASGGRFDITMGSVVRLWDFKEGIVPHSQLIAEALGHVDYRGVRAEEAAVQLLDPFATLDLGGIAKGYIADRITESLRAAGVGSAIVNLGGNVAVLGSKPDGNAWRVGLRMPLPSYTQHTEQSFAAVDVRDCSVVTSGIYERAFQHEGRLFHHILDPASGYPAQTDLLGASVIAQRSIDADGYSTALIIMGLDEALAFVEGQPGIEAVFITTAGEVFASSGIGEEIPLRLLGQG
jgi:thiamine biosynthesis lipoprotein